MSNNVFTPTTDVDELYGDGDWRPILGEGPRKLDYKFYMIGKQSIEHKLKGVLLPSFDWTMSLDDQSFFAKAGPCWTASADKRLPRHFAPNAFALPLLMYPFMGESKEHWISPYNRAKMIGCDTTDPAECADAFDDLNKWVRMKYRKDPKMKDFFLKAEKLSDDALVPGRTARFFSLAWCKDKDNDWHPAVVGYTSSAYSYLIEQMRWPQPHGEEARDPDWPQYLLGDPTNPENAMVWHVDKVQIDPKDAQDTNVLCFTERREFLDPSQEFKKIPQEILENRFRLPEPENWNFPTYEEQVRYMMEHYDPAVTAEMIRAACSSRCREEIPHDRPEHVKLMGSSEGSPDEGEAPRRSRTAREDTDDDPMAAVTGGGQKSKFAPSSSAPPQPDIPDETPKQKPEAKPAPATKPPASSSETYFAGLPKQKPQKLTVAELQGIADRGEHEGVKVMVSKDNWKSLADSGLVTLPEPDPIVPDDEAPTVPDDDEAPTVPDDDEAPTVPDDGPVEGGLSKAQFREKLFPAWEDLSAEQQGKAASLVDRAYAATKNGSDPALPDDLVKEMMAVMS